MALPVIPVYALEGRESGKSVAAWIKSTFADSSSSPHGVTSSCACSLHPLISSVGFLSISCLPDQTSVSLHTDIHCPSSAHDPTISVWPRWHHLQTNCYLRCRSNALHPRHSQSSAFLSSIGGRKCELGECKGANLKKVHWKWPFQNKIKKKKFSEQLQPQSSLLAWLRLSVGTWRLSRMPPGHISGQGAAGSAARCSRVFVAEPNDSLPRCLASLCGAFSSSSRPSESTHLSKGKSCKLSVQPQRH